MSYTTCADALKNIGIQCNQKATAGFTGRGIIAIQSEATVTRDSDGDILTLTAANKVLVDNVWANALDGTQASLSTDNGRPMWHHDISVRLPRVGDGKDTRDNVKALARNSIVGIFEREDGTYLAVGFDGKLIATAETQAENAAGGDWVVTLGSDESTPEVLFVDDPETATNPQTAKQKFNAMWDAIAA